MTESPSLQTRPGFSPKSQILTQLPSALEPTFASLHPLSKHAPPLLRYLSRKAKHFSSGPGSGTGTSRLRRDWV